jgi:D-alanyl-D-alanine carboxypeptidase
MVPRCRLTLLLLLCVCSATLPVKAQLADASGKAAFDDEQLARITRRIQSRLDEWRVTSKFPGASVGVILPDGRVASVSTGVADLKTRQQLKPSDRMPAGSIGKTFVAAEALLLVEEGKLSLDEKIESRLGGETWFAELPNAKEITLRMLMNHSSGIPNHVDNGSFMKALFKDSSRDIKYEELIAYVLNKKPLFPAGKGFYYADTNYIILGLIIEKATGKTLYDQITERILKPLKLDQTIPSNARTLPRVANGYFQNKPIITGGKFTVNPQWEWAGGGFASTAEDLARWARALYGGSVLAAKSLDEMLRSTTTGEGKNYGLGVEIVQSKWGRAFGHDGEFPGYLSDMRYYPSYKISVAVQVNSDETPEVSRFMASVVDDFAQIIIEETALRKLTEEDKLKLQTLTESWLKLIDTGKYAESWEKLSAELKAKYAKEKWQSALQPLTGKTGKLRARKLKGLNYSDPEAQTVTAEFESSFTKFAPATEIVILKLEADGKWRVASYSIK